MPRLLTTVGQLLAVTGAIALLGLVAGGLVADLAVERPGARPVPRWWGISPLPTTVALLLAVGVPALGAAVARARQRRRHQDDRWAEWRSRFPAG